MANISKFNIYGVNYNIKDAVATQALQTKPGQKTEQGEIFNDYENNIAQGAFSHAEGLKTATIPGLSLAEAELTYVSYADNILTLNDAGTFLTDNVASIYGFHVKNRDSRLTPDFCKVLSYEQVENNWAFTIETPSEDLNLSTPNEFAIDVILIDETIEADSQHVEGSGSLASGLAAHAEGQESLALSNISHAEGWGTIAYGRASHTEGYNTKTTDNYGHAEGTHTVAGYNAHAEGALTSATGTNSHSEGVRTIASGTTSHAEGYETQAIGGYSHSEGKGSQASGSVSHAEGYGTVASNSNSHSEGVRTIASGTTSHAEGYETQAIGIYSHSEGKNSQASGAVSHAEGYDTVASNDMAHAEGVRTIASGTTSHAEGYGSKATNSRAHAEGYNTEAKHSNSHAEGSYTKTGASNQSVKGTYNIGKEDTLVEVGNGTADNARSNAFEVYRDGHAEVQVQGTTDNSVVLKKSLGEAIEDALNQSQADWAAAEYTLNGIKNKPIIIPVYDVMPELTIMTLGEYPMYCFYTGESMEAQGSSYEKACFYKQSQDINPDTQLVEPRWVKLDFLKEEDINSILNEELPTFNSAYGVSCGGHKIVKVYDAIPSVIQKETDQYRPITSRYAGYAVGHHGIARFSTMPTAASKYLGWIVLYTGATDDTYTSNTLYKCINDGGYKWVEYTTNKSYDSITMADRETGKHYSLYIYNGELMIEESDS